MKNEYGVTLDSNGYAPSIFDQSEECFVCGRGGDLVRHEIFHGNNRKRSKEYGLWVQICPYCHNEIHMGRKGLDGLLKNRACRDAKLFYGWSDDEFRLRFGKNYWEAVT